MLPGVLARAKGCPDSEAVDALRNAAMEFCTRTYALTISRTLVLTAGNQPWPEQYTDQVVDIVDARIAGESIPVVSANDPCVLDLGSNQRVLQFADPSYVTLTPAPTPEVPVTLELLLVVAPGPASTGVHDVLWLRHSEALRFGALARLLMGPGSWVMPPAAAFYGQAFERAIREAAPHYGRNRRTTARRLRVIPV